MPTTNRLVCQDPSDWLTGPGNWCYASTTRAVRGTLLNERRSLQEIAHNFYLSIYQVGGASAAGIAGTRGAAIDAYLAAVQTPGYQAVSFAQVRQWITEGKITDPTSLLGEAWGEVNLAGLKEDSINSSSASAETEIKICTTLDANGVVIVGTQLHFKVIYGYEVDVDDGENVVARRFLVWDAGTGVASTPADLADFDGSRLTFVTR